MCLHNCKSCYNNRTAYNGYFLGDGRKIDEYNYCFLTQYEVTDWKKKYIYCEDWIRRLII